MQTQWRKTPAVEKWVAMLLRQSIIFEFFSSLMGHDMTNRLLAGGSYFTGARPRCKSGLSQGISYSCQDDSVIGETMLTGATGPR